MLNGWKTKHVGTVDCRRSVTGTTIAPGSLLPTGTVGGVLAFAFNVIWFFVAGLWLAIAHLGYAIACAVTIIGLPFAFAHLKLALLALRLR